MKPSVFVTRSLPGPALQLAAEHCELDVWPGDRPAPRAELMARAPHLDGLLCGVWDVIDTEFFDAAPRLRVVANFGVGFNNIDVAEATRRGIQVGNTPDVLTEATADLALALMLAAARNLRTGYDDVRNGQWTSWQPAGYMGQELAGKTLGIVGLGRIGSAVARRCHGGWGMEVVYFNRGRNESAERTLNARRVDLHELLSLSDFVSLHCPMSEANRHLMGREQFRLMKPSAVFVNTSRGGLVDEAALEHALRTNVIFAAGIDVTDPEPPDPAHTLLTCPNLFVTPHIASGTVTARHGMTAIAVNNLLAGLRGDRLPCGVN